MATKAQRGFSEPADLEAPHRDSVAVMRVTTVSEAVSSAGYSAEDAGRADLSQAQRRDRPTVAEADPLLPVREAEEAEREVTAREADFDGVPSDEVTQRSQNLFRDNSRRDSRPSTAFVANVGDIPMADLLRTIASGGKTGVVTVRHTGGCSRLWLENGDVIDAECGRLFGEVAVYRMLGIGEGELVADFVAVDRERRVTMSLQGLLMEAAFREDQCAGLHEQLGGAGQECVAQLEDGVPDGLSLEESGVLSLLEQEQSMHVIVATSPFGDVETLTALQALRERGLVRVGAVEAPMIPTAPESEIRQIRPENRAPERNDASLAFDVLDVSDIRQVLEAGRQRQRRILLAVGVVGLLVAAAIAYSFMGMAAAASPRADNMLAAAVSGAGTQAR